MFPANVFFTNFKIHFQAKYQTELPLLVFGTISLLGSVATFFLPETCDKDLPNTVNDANKFGIEQSYLDCILCSKIKAREKEIEKGEKEDPLLLGTKVVECENLDRISIRQCTLST